jgi:simple sugar transport system ATP-binding protein
MEEWANRDVSLELKQGEILCIAGENGAGKSTLMKILCGHIQPTEGEILVDGRPVRIGSQPDAGRLGIGMVHQHFMLFPEYTVAQNVVMGIEPRRGKVFYDFTEANIRVARVIQEHGFSLDVHAPAGSLTVGQMQQVEILKLLYRDCRIVVLDEPTSVLTDQEIGSLFATFKKLAGAGKSLIFITHKPGEIKRVSHRVAVMRRGKLLGVWDTAAVDEYEISRIMMGGDGAEGLSAGTAGGGDEKPAGAGEGAGDPVLVFEDVTVLRRGQSRPVLDRISFSLRPGEILGFAGVGGNGLGTLEAVLGGFLPVTGGRILHAGKDITRLKTRALRRRGLAYVPGDRLAVGSAPDASLTENLIVNRRRSLSPRGIFRAPAVAAFAGDLIRRYRVAGKPGQPLRSLSGGNIQKLILAREIEQYQDYIVFSEPTWGLDLSSGRAVYEQIALLRSRGAGIIIISTNLDELLLNADRIIVFYRGAAAAELPNPAERRGDTYRAAMKEEIGAYMLGLKRREANHA